MLRKAWNLECTCDVFVPGRAGFGHNLSIKEGVAGFYSFVRRGVSFCISLLNLEGFYYKLMAILLKVGNKFYIMLDNVDNS